MSATDFTAADRAALDRVTVPAMRGGFAADVVTAATGGARVPPRRGPRGWRGHGRILLGAGALVLASATAAATGLLDRLPISIPGFTRAADKPETKPKHIVSAPKSRPTPGKSQAPASPAAFVPPALDPQAIQQWRTQRQARVAAGLPVRRPLVRRALMAMSPGDRQAAVAEWRRIRTLPPAERKQAIVRLKADYLARHPRVAAKVEARMEARSAAAASAGDPVKAQPLGQPQTDMPRPEVDPERRAQRREAWRQWRMQRRARRLQMMNGEGLPPPVR